MRTLFFIDDGAPAPAEVDMADATNDSEFGEVLGKDTNERTKSVLATYRALI